MHLSVICVPDVETLLTQAEAVSQKIETIGGLACQSCSKSKAGSGV